MRHRLGLATRTRISVCKSPFPSTGTAVSLFRAKTVQQRPLLPREVETQLPERGVANWVRIDHLSLLPVMPPSDLTNHTLVHNEKRGYSRSHNNESLSSD